MNSLYNILILTIVGAAIGYVTNILAIKLLFRPLKPIAIPLTPFKLIGLIPKRKAEIAKNIGEIVSTELLSVDELLTEALQKEDIDEVKFYIKNKIKAVIDEKMIGLPSMFKVMVTGYIDDMIDKEIDDSLDELTEKLKNTIKDRIDIAELVEHKIITLDLREIERIILQVAKKELRHIELLGLFLGGIIGLIQGLILMYL